MTKNSNPCHKATKLSAYADLTADTLGNASRELTSLASLLEEIPAKTASKWTDTLNAQFDLIKEVYRLSSALYKSADKATSEVMAVRDA